jgi:hypothetical protein
MRELIVALGVLAGCGGAPATATEPARRTPIATTSNTAIVVDPSAVLVDAAVEPLVHDAHDAPVGAVPIPDTVAPEEPPIHLIDREVVFEELPRPTARWQMTKKLQHSGRVLIALHVVSHTSLGLSMVNTKLAPGSEYPGTLDRFDLGPTASQDSPTTGNAYPSRDSTLHTDGSYTGSIRFAIRPRLRNDAADSERRQVVVYVVGRTVFVAERLLGTAAWTPRLRLELPRAKEIVGIDPGWH